jgi:TRAP-type C4-dicarboxylate transport system substrate-binding protein
MTPIPLRISHYMPPEHGTHADFIAPWARALEQRSGGAIATTIFDGTTPLGVLANQYDQVLRGAVDVAHSPGHLPRGRFPRTALVGLPFLADSAAMGTRLLRHLLPRLEVEYADFRILALHADAGGLLHTRDRPIERLVDLAGLRIRTPNQLISDMITALGGIPVPLAPPDINAALRSGAIDGAAMPWDVVLYTGSDAYLRHHLDDRLYVSPLYFVMNRARYDALPPELQQAVDDVSGDALTDKFGEWWKRWEEPGVAAVLAQGHAITHLREGELARWRQAVQPVIDRRLEALEAEGIDAAAIYDAARRYLESGAP